MSNQLHHAHLHQLNRTRGSSPLLSTMLPRNLRRRNMSPSLVTGHCLQLSGTAGQYATLDKLAQEVNTLAATFECWIQTSMTAPQAIAQTDSAAFLFSMANNQLQFNWASQQFGGGTVRSADQTPISDGAWHHIAIVFDRGTVTFYKDGLPLPGAGSIAQTIPSLLLLELGTSPADYGLSNFKGLLYDIRVWTTARKQQEIQGFMYAQLTGLEPNLAAVCNFLNGSFTNQVTNVTGQLVGGAALVETTIPQTPPPVGQWSVATNGAVSVPPELKAGALIYATNSVYSATDATFTGYIRSLDTRDHVENWAYDPAPGIPKGYGLLSVTQAVPESGNLVFGAVAVTPKSAALPKTYYLDAIDRRTGQRQWRAPVNLAQFGSEPVDLTYVPTASKGLVLMGASFRYVENMTNGGVMVALDASKQGAIAWHVPIDTVVTPKPLPLTGFSPAAVAGGVAVFAANFRSDVLGSAGRLYAVNVATRAVLWKFESDAPMNAAPVISNGTVYIGSESGNLYALDLQTGAQKWVHHVSGSIQSRPALMGGSLFFGDSNSFYALNLADGTLLWDLDIGNGGLNTDVLIQDGLAYFATPGEGDTPVPTIYSVDLATNGNDVIRYEVPDADLVQSNAVGAGVVYFYGSNTIYAVNMDNLIHEFNAQTKLIVEDYDTAQQPPVGKSSAYRVTLSLLDTSKNPRPLQAVRLWSSAPLTFTYDWETYTVGPDQWLWLETDHSGQLTLSIPANPVDADGQTTPQVHCPPLIAWSNFMLPNEAIVIYPDHEVLGTLSNMQAANPNPSDPDSKGLDTAKSYDGKPMVKDGYDNADARTAIASAIRSTIGNHQNAALTSVGTVALAGATSTSKYLAFPERMPFAVYQAVLGSTDRLFVPGAVPHWSLDIGSSVVFKPLSAEAAAQRFAQLQAARINSLNQPENVFTDIADFFKNIIHGAENVLDTVWQWEEGVVKTIIRTVESTYQLVVKTIEDVATCLIGLVKSLINDIKQFIEFLSYLFNFDDIIKTHQNIVSTFQASIGTFKTWVDGQVTQDAREVTDFFAGIKKQVNVVFDAQIQKLQGNTIETYRSQNNDVNGKVYTQKGQDKSGPCTWMQEKFKASTSSNAPSSSIRPGNGLSEKLFVPFFPAVRTFDAPEETLEQAFNDFMEALAAVIKNDFAPVIDAVGDLLSTLPQLFSNPQTFTQNALADVLKTVEAVADAFLDIASAATVFFLKMLQIVVDELVGLALAKIDIPVISALYKALFDDDLSILDLIALLVAIPSTIITKIIDGPPAPASANGPSSTDSSTATKVASGILMIIQGIIDTIAVTASAADEETDQAAKAVNRLAVVGDALLVTLSQVVVIKQFENFETHDWIFFSLQFFPIVSGAVGVLGGTSKWAVIWGKLSHFFNFIYGIAFAVTSCFYAGHDEENYGGLVLAGNIVGGAAPNVIEPMLVDPANIAIVAPFKFLTEEAAAIMAFINYFTQPNAGQALGRAQGSI